MSDTQAPQGERRRRPNNRRRQGAPQNRNRETFRPNRPKAPKQTTFQKILSFLTFGLLGKPKSSARPPRREPTSNVTVVTSKRGEGEGRSRDRDPDRGPPRDRAPRQQPPADPSTVSSGRLYVGNLSYDASESDLFELFNGVGDVRNAEVVVNNRTQRSKGFAFVTMASTEEARRAVTELHGKDFMGRSLQISGAKPASNREEGSEDAEASEADEAEE
jgi:hypothetical protein